MSVTFDVRLSLVAQVCWDWGRGNQSVRLRQDGVCQFYFWRNPIKESINTSSREITVSWINQKGQSVYFGSFLHYTLR